jgi:hypothetical protein
LPSSRIAQPILRRLPNHIGYVIGKLDQLVNPTVPPDGKKNLLGLIGLGLPLNQQTGRMVPAAAAEPRLNEHPS